MNGERAKWGYVSSGNYYGPGQASRHVQFFGVGVLSRFVKRFNDYYFQVELRFCANLYLSIRNVVFSYISEHILFVIVNNIWAVKADNKLVGGC